jgi:hypothetical protein
MPLRWPLSILTLALTTALPAVAAAQSGVTLLPHRAVYEIALAPGSSPGDRPRIEEARGRLVYEFMGSACEGYTTNLRFVTELRLGDGQMHVTDIRSNTFESATADEFRFVTSSVVNNTPRDQSDGTARRVGDRVEVELRRPQARRFEISGDVVFPTQHMLGALAAGRGGRPFFPADIYDGSEGGQKVFGTNAIIGRPVTTAFEGPAATVEVLRDRPRVPINISFFERAREGGEQTPLYQLRVEVYEEGVTRQLTIDYGGFALVGRMTSLEILPVTACN